jgi:hypothetical protein
MGMPTSHRKSPPEACESAAADDRAAAESPAAGTAAAACEVAPAREVAAPRESAAPREIGGREGPEPTRFGDWEKHGRCIDF